MIGKAKAISHGINDLRYIMGESMNKKHPEKINFICSQHLPADLDAMGVWDSIQASTAGYDKLKNTLIQVELSPSKEHTDIFNLKDWKELWIDFMNEFDSLTLYNEEGKIISRPTNLTGSKGVVFLHEESKGKIPHLHGAFSRVDEDGNVNNDHSIHLRAQRAAEAVARKRGWKTAIEVRTSDMKNVAEVCMNVLKAMNSWSWDEYVARIERVDGGRLKVKPRIDSLGQVRGYAIICGRSKYKASQLGRELTSSRLAATWRKLHPVVVGKPEAKTFIGSTITSKVIPAAPVRLKAKEVYPPQQSPKSETLKSNATKSQLVNRVDYSSWSSDRRSVNIDVNGTQHQLFLPKNALKVFDDEFDYREVLNWKPLTNLACAYFTALLAPDVQASNGGGSSSNDNWGRDKDEDDIEFARRCAQQAKMKIGIQKKTRGYHR